jgi:hypothetical protein
LDVQRSIRLGILLVASVGLGSLSLAVCGCDSTGGSSTVLVEKKEDLEKRENTIKDFYKTKKPAAIKKSR